MWPFKNKEKKITKLSPGEDMKIGFTTLWRRDKDEVTITTDSGPIVLDGKNELFIIVTAENIDPIKIQMVPDFKNKTISLVEVIDLNVKKKFPDKDGFAGSVINERGIYLKNWDQNMEKFEKLIKRSKRIRDIFVPINIILFFWNSYVFVTNNDNTRYLSLFGAILSLCLIYYALNSHRKLYKDYIQYKEYKDNMFGIVKNI